MSSGNFDIVYHHRHEIALLVAIAVVELQSDLKVLILDGVLVVAASILTGFVCLISFAAAVKLLLDMGSDINAQIETNRNTALTLACFQVRSNETLPINKFIDLFNFFGNFKEYNLFRFGSPLSYRCYPFNLI